MENEKVQTEISASPEAPKFPIEAISEETLAPLSIEELEGLKSHLHQMYQAIRDKARLVHDVQEAKQHLADKTVIAAKYTDEEADAMMAALQNRKAAKPPTQNLIGSKIESDTVVKPAEAVKAAE